MTAITQFLNDHPTFYLTAFLVVMVGMCFLFRALGRRYRFVPGEDHDPVKHRPLWSAVALAGFLVLTCMLLFGYGDIPSSAVADPQAASAKATPTE